MTKIKNIKSVKYWNDSTRIDYFFEGEEVKASFYWGAIVKRDNTLYEAIIYINNNQTFDQELNRQSFNSFEQAENFIKKMLEIHHYIKPIINEIEDFFNVKYEYDYQDNKDFWNFFEYENWNLNWNVYFFDNELLSKMIYEIQNEDKAEWNFSFFWHILKYKKDNNKLEINIYESKENFKDNKIKNSFVFDLKTYNFKPHEYELEKIKDFVNDLDEYLI